MATLERRRHDGQNCYRLRFMLDKRRQSLALTGFDGPAAQVAREHVEHLIVQRHRDRPPCESTVRWLDDLPNELHDRLAFFGLTEARKRSELPRTVLAFMRVYIKSRTDWKKPQTYDQAVDKLEEFLKGDVLLGSLTKGEAERWHRWMIHNKKLSRNTAGQNVKRCRQMMRQAIDEDLAETNPFAGIKIDLRSDASKNRFVNAQACLAVLKSCPDLEWRVLIALVRYGGLRCPSEVLRLRWIDIDWDRQRFRVRAPKTERYGKGERIVPLFPELHAELEKLRHQTPLPEESVADEYVITRYRSSESNLRTALGRILDKASVERFPKPFMALRASRRTELERSGRFANHVLNDWFGHSGRIAEKHYLQTTEEDYREAAEGEDMRASASSLADGEQSLHHITEAWPTLPQHIRDTIVLLVSAATSG